MVERNADRTTELQRKRFREFNTQKVVFKRPLKFNNTLYYSHLLGIGLLKS